jgi:hypothetical protein
VLNEGRLLFTSQRVNPDSGESMIMVMLPDGSKAVKYYQGLNGSYSTGKLFRTGMDSYISLRTMDQQLPMACHPET